MKNLFIENSRYGQEAFVALQDTAKVALNGSFRLWEKQLEAAGKAANRFVSRALQAQQVASVDDAVALQHRSGETELSEWQQSAREYWDVVGEVGKEFGEVSEKNRALLENAAGEAVEKSVSLVANGDGAAISKAVLSSFKATNDLLANGVKHAFAAAQSQVDSAMATAEKPKTARGKNRAQ